MELCEPVLDDCGFCGASQVQCVYPESLGQWFSTLVATYQESDDGMPLVDRLVHDWDLFAESGLTAPAAKDLLAEILDDGEIVRRNFAPIDYPESQNLRRWEDLRDELMHKNRWFLSDPIDLDRIGVLLDKLITPLSSLAGTKWYRARLANRDESIPLEKMGAPPPHLAGHGRANPAGIPYLYLGSTPSTSVAELRPHTGERAFVAEFEMIRDDLKFADLRDPRRLVTPLLDDENGIIRLRADLPLLERLGEELTRPVHQHGAPYEYIPTQYLCEHIKNRGFDGVIYRSSVSSDNGINVAIFRPAVANALVVSEVLVEQVTVRINGDFELA